ncbi:stage III sporulation protein AB [Eubacteriales bacterium OttesenSCG-928-N13]|nr:stage III sporulation protein AB [Eubacteriales bacterium OttesenSCG-928-N13]
MNTWTIRLVACLVMTACCAMAGRSLCVKERRRVAMIDGLRQALPMLSIEMLERMLPLPQALRMSGQPLFIEIADGIESGMGAREAWIARRDQLVIQGEMLDCLMPDDLVRLDQLFEGLGASGISAQRLLLTEAERALDVQLTLAKKRADERGKLYTNLGLLGGLAISVFLL